MGASVSTRKQHMSHAYPHETLGKPHIACSSLTKLHTGWTHRSTIPNRKNPCHGGLGPKSPGQQPGPDRVLASRCPPRAHASNSSIQKLVLCKRLLAKRNGTAQSAHAKSRFRNYQAEPSISQTRHRHTHHKSIPRSSRVH